MTGGTNVLGNKFTPTFAKSAVGGEKHDMVGRAGPTDDVFATTTIFEAFKEVALDLTFSFSPQNSPTVSTSEVPAPRHTPTPPPPVSFSPPPRASVEPADTLSRSFSFTSHLKPLRPLKKTREKSKFSEFLPRHSSSARQSSLSATVSYAGRGTPMHKSRAMEWGGLPSGRFSEDGLLFSSDIRAMSLDSRLARLSSSSDWDFLNPGPSLSGSLRSGRRSILSHGLAEDEEEEKPPPKIEVKLENGIENWASVMESALSSAEKGGLSRERPPTITEEVEEQAAIVAKGAKVEQPVDVAKAAQDGHDSATDNDQLPVGKEDEQPEVQFDVHIDKALDLGFTPAGNGGTLFNLTNAAADSDSSDLTAGRAPSESSLSQYSTPSEGPSDSRPPGDLTATVFPPALKDQVKYEGGSALQPEGNLRDSMSLCPGVGEGPPWWRKGVEKLKRFQILLRNRRNVC